ncbi:hypothetical protein CEE39_08740 [bacterium (candidate division B38) B3_B38]|nr:MAG: hypothetical protein CEE39_08740 [bacterium (candidate division B38) B3_B38]
MSSLWRRAPLILISGISLAVGLYVRSKIPELTVGDPRIRWDTASVYWYLALSLLAIMFIWWGYSALVGLILKLNRREVMRGDALTYIPLWFLLLSYIPARFYLYKADLLKNNLILWVLVIGGCLYLKGVHFYHLWSKARHPAAIYLREGLKEFISSPSYPRRKRIGILFLLSLLIYLFLASGILAPLFQPTGDEPHYLLITHSLIKDHDINLRNNYDHRDYSPFYQGKLATHTRTGKRGASYQYPTHLFGISLYLVPFYWLGLHLPAIGVLFFVHLGMILLTSLLGVQLYLLLLELLRQPKVSFYSWLVFTFTVPMVLYSRHIYPEVAVALLTIYLFRKLRTSSFTSSWQILFQGCLVAMMIWFGVKYGVTAGVLSLMFLYFFWKRRRIDAKIIYFIIPCLVSLVIMFAFIYHMYELFSPMAIVKGLSLGKSPSPTIIPFSQRIKAESSLILGTIFTYFFDQKRGLFIYSPIYFFALMGLYFLIKKDKRVAFHLLSLFVPYLAMYVGFKLTGGYAPPTRPLVSVTWILAVFLAYFLAYNRNRKFYTTAKILGAVSLCLVILLTYYPYSLYHTHWAVDTSREAKLLITLSNLKLNFANFFPSFSLAGGNLYWIPNHIWFWGSLAIFFLYIRRKKGKEESPISQQIRSGWHLGVSIFVIAICFPLIAIFPRVNLQENAKLPVLGNSDAFLYRQIRSRFGSELMGFWIRGETEESFVIESRKKLRRITLHLHSPQENLIRAGIYEQMHYAKLPLNRRGRAEWTLYPSAHYQCGKDTYYYYLTIGSEKGFVPWDVIPGSRDPRYLGVFVRVELVPY